MKNYSKELYKSKEEWLSHRGIGSSEAAAICGVSKWMSPSDIYSKLVLGKQPNITENERMREGTLAETHIRELFALDHPQYKVKNPPRDSHWLFRRNDYPLMTCTPDGLMQDIETKKWYGLEIKDVEMRSSSKKELWENNQLPDQYYYQCLQYMLVLTDLDGVCLNAHMKYFTHDEENDKWVFDYAVDRSYWVFRKDVQSHIDYLFNKEKDFIEININGRKRPKLVIKF